MKTILITGANGGIGLACARAFLDHEPACAVRLGCRASRDAAEALAAASDGRAKVVDLDVTSPASWEAAVAGILAETGRIDVLVNNAGSHRDSLLATMSDEAWQEVIAANLTGTFFGCRAVVRPMMAQRFGRIVNIASLSALLAPAGQTNYAAAKAGVVALTQSLAKEVARAGITVNAVCPGYIDTGALGTDETARAAMVQRVPARRFGTPDEVAAAVRFLAGLDAAYVNGSVLKLDGGIL